VGRLKNKGMFERVVGMEVKMTYWGDDMVIFHEMDEDKAHKINHREQVSGGTPFISL